MSWTWILRSNHQANGRQGCARTGEIDAAEETRLQTQGRTLWALLTDAPINAGSSALSSRLIARRSTGCQNSGPPTGTTCWPSACPSIRCSRPRVYGGSTTRLSRWPKASRRPRIWSGTACTCRESGSGWIWPTAFVEFETRAYSVAVLAVELAMTFAQSPALTARQKVRLLGKQQEDHWTLSCVRPVTAE